jgi:diguanylate cyclase (GGDEF)-like protein
MHESLHAWRSREGSALLALYAILIAIVSAVLAYPGSPAHFFTGAPRWVGVLPAAVSFTLAASLLWAPGARSAAYRLQALNVGCFLFVLAYGLVTGAPGISSVLIVVICAFSVQYAFVSWEALVAAYTGMVVFYAALLLGSGAVLRPARGFGIEVLAPVCAICVALGIVRLRSQYAAERARAELERQTAELRRQNGQKARLASIDHLTGMLNRSGVNELIDRALALSQRRGGSETALLYVDLDGFKQINDISGHDAGDLALVEAGLRIQYVLRSGETAGRIGGDEFVIVLPWVQSIDEARAVARRVERAFDEPFSVGRETFRMSASIGIALSCEQWHTRSELLSAADKAMYVVKRLRKLERTAAARLS